MSCEDIRAELTGLLDDELASEEAERVRSHLAGCADCRRDRAALEGTRAHIRAILLQQPIDPKQSLAAALHDVLARLDDPVPTGTDEASLTPESRHAFGQRPASVARAHEQNRPATARRGRSARRSAPLARGRSLRRPWALAGALALAATALVLSVDRAILFGPAGGASVGRPTTAAGTAPEPGVVAARRSQGAKQTANADSSPPASGRPSASAAARVAARGSSRGPGEATTVAARGDVGPDLSVPEEVRSHPGMFLDLEMVKRLDKLRNLEAVYRQPGAGEGTGSSG